MSQKPSVFNLLSTMLKVGAPPERTRPQPTTITNVAGTALPDFAEANPADVQMITVEHPDGRMSQYPPPAASGRPRWRGPVSRNPRRPRSC